MHMRIAALVLSTCLLPTLVHAQASGWRPTGNSATPASRYNNKQSTQTADARNAVAPPGSPVTPQAAKPQTARPVTATGHRITRAPVTKGPATLPNDHGQVWREYDISSYTLRLQSTSNSSSIGSCAKRATKRGTRRPSGCSAPTAASCVSITRRKCKRSSPTLSIDL